MFLSMPVIPSWLTDNQSRQAATLFQGDGLLPSIALLLTLVLLEAVLSADNAVALASLVKHVQPAVKRQRLLNAGLILAVGLRLAALAAAGFVLHQPSVRLLGGGYLVWLALVHFQNELQTPTVPDSKPAAAIEPPRGLIMVLLIAGTDLAFSLDSVGAAVALSDRLPLVLMAGAMGVLLLRWMAVGMLTWMERFANLQNAGYLTVLAVGLRLIAQVLIPALAPSEPMLLLLVLVVFGWGFSQIQATEP